MFSVRVEAELADEFCKQLTATYGQALPMPRRGSKRARPGAGGVLLLGLMLAAVG